LLFERHACFFEDVERHGDAFPGLNVLAGAARYDGDSR
jgi:hypothetical protein